MSKWTTQRQLDAMAMWLRSDGGQDAAIRLVRKYGLLDAFPFMAFSKTTPLEITVSD